MRSILFVGGLAALLIVLSCSFAWSTQVIPRSSQELGKDSALVIRGTVESVRSFWTPSRTKIFTEVHVLVDEGYKGGAPSTVRVLQLGGVVDNVKVTVSGALQWSAKEEVLLFLEPYVADAYQVSGFSQGKFLIERDPYTGAAYVSRGTLDGIDWVGTSAQKSGDATAPVEKTSLDRFLDDALGQR